MSSSPKTASVEAPLHHDHHATDDDSVLVQVQQALASSPVYELRGLTVESVGDSLLISGQVDSFYHKQLAQETVIGATEQDPAIRNNVAVRAKHRDS